MINAYLDGQRFDFLQARVRVGDAELPAWPRAQKRLDVVELDVEWVRFSTLNHRTRAEQRARVARIDEDLFGTDPLGPVAQEAQFEILSTQDGFQELKSDLAARGQQEPAVITADGILINGNRRAAALRSLFLQDNHLPAKYVKCLLLPSDATNDELVDLETELQIARDFKQGYGWINEALLIEELYERENRDFARVANRMHRELNDVRTQYEKLQQVHQLVAISGGSKQLLEFNENESAFDELTKHIRGKQNAEAEAVRSVYFLGTLANVQYRRLRHLRRADAESLVENELSRTPEIAALMVDDAADETIGTDPLDDVLGESQAPRPIETMLRTLATRSSEDVISLPTGETIEVRQLLETVRGAVDAAAAEAEEDARDQRTQMDPIARADKAITEFERALSALRRARAFEGFDEPAMEQRVSTLKKLIASYYTGKE
ncbi:hypothetical protein [Curtobacterium sp. BH-2-1-1]|uniref:hypothetical protein n=1 Tax=Curtobacterium sp. BH-2-1-1 TaxID=1905847 RepID=UPI0012EAB52E|nr:hypothetical protein [Curtobacterium sp. BH-2-1-1]